jgi:CRISPR-associated endonuclease Cas2
MMLAITGGRPARLVVLAYDITSPRRARCVRRILDSRHHAKQYSVFEVMLGDGELRGVLAEISTCCDFESDLLAAWWPADGLRLGWRQGRLTVTARNGEPCQTRASLRPNIGNFVVCYDVSDADALVAVAKEVAREGAMIQRSVYWLRIPTTRLTTLLQRCTGYLADGDRLWAYPLAGSRDLWHVGTPSTSIIPISTHRWRSS